MPTVKETKEYIARAHAGQLDKAGRPYVEHLKRVHANLLAHFPGATEEEEHAALLHDVVEDGHANVAELLERGYSAAVVEMVMLVTSPPRVKYEEFIRQIITSGNKGAIRVKLSDVLDNSNPERLAKLEPPMAAALSEKYARALEMLKAVAA